MANTPSKSDNKQPEYTFHTCQIISAELAATLKEHPELIAKIDSFLGQCDNPSFSDLDSSQPASPTSKSKPIYFGGMCVKKLMAKQDREGQDKPMGQCFELFTNKSIIEHYNLEGAYILTPGWLIDWENRVKSWGFDRELAAQFFHESCKYLLMLDTLVYSESSTRLQKFAEYVRLPFKILPVGLDIFSIRAERVIYRIKYEAAIDSVRKDSVQLQQELSDYAMAMDIIQQITQSHHENDVLNLILYLFNMLFAPRQLSYLSLNDNQDPILLNQYGQRWNEPQIITELQSLSEQYIFHPNKNGFRLQILWGGKLLGIIDISDVKFPQHNEHYLSLALSLCEIFGLAIANVRSYELIVDQKEQLENSFIQIKNLLKEKEILLQEVHHRIKNNMNTIVALLELHAMETEEAAAAIALQDAQSRVHSMMVLYDQLFISQGFDELSLKSYLGELIKQGVEIFPNSGNIDLDLHLEDITLPVKPMMNLGIVVNEILTNSMKYAFLNQDSGKIMVSATVAENQLQLLIQDNGQGIPKDTDIQNSTGFGMNLIQSYIKQLGGTFEIQNQSGTQTKINIPIDQIL